MSESFKTYYGYNSNFCEDEIQDFLNAKIGNGDFNQAIVNALMATLPQNIDSLDWRKQGYTDLQHYRYQKL